MFYSIYKYPSYLQHSNTLDLDVRVERQCLDRNAPDITSISISNLYKVHIQYETGIQDGISGDTYVRHGLTSPQYCI